MIGQICDHMSLQEAAKPTQQLWDGQLRRKNQARVSASLFLPLLSEQQEVLAIKGDKGRPF